MVVYPWIGKEFHIDMLNESHYGNPESFYKEVRAYEGLVAKVKKDPRKTNVKKARRILEDLEGLIEYGSKLKDKEGKMYVAKIEKLEEDLRKIYNL